MQLNAQYQNMKITKTCIYSLLLWTAMQNAHCMRCKMQLYIQMAQLKSENSNENIKKTSNRARRADIGSRNAEKKKTKKR